MKDDFETSMLVAVGAPDWFVHLDEYFRKDSTDWDSAVASVVERVHPNFDQLRLPLVIGLMTLVANRELKPARAEHFIRNLNNTSNPAKYLRGVWSHHDGISEDVLLYAADALHPRIQSDTVSTLIFQLIRHKFSFRELTTAILSAWGVPRNS